MKTKVQHLSLPNIPALLSILFLTSALVLLSISAMAQDKNTIRNVNVEMNDDGEKTVTIEEVKDGQTVVQVLTGDEAEAWLAKEAKSDLIWVSDEDIDVDRVMIEKNNDHQTIIIKANTEMIINADENGEVTKKIIRIDGGPSNELEMEFTGEDAESGEIRVISDGVEMHYNIEQLREDASVLRKELGEDAEMERIIIIEQYSSESTYTDNNIDFKVVRTLPVGQNTFMLAFSLNRKAVLDIEVMDSNGEVVYSDSYKGNGSYVEDIELPESGTYTLKISGGDLKYRKDVSVH